MFKRIVFSSFFALASVFAFADDVVAEQPAAPVDSASVQAVSSAVVQSSSSQAVSSSSEEAPTWREVPVRYWVNGDELEGEYVYQATLGCDEWRFYSDGTVEYVGFMPEREARSGFHNLR